MQQEGLFLKKVRLTKQCILLFYGGHARLVTYAIQSKIKLKLFKIIW